MNDTVISISTRTIEMGVGETPSNFVVKFSPPIVRNNKFHTMHVQSLDTWNSVHTHNAEQYGNTVFTVGGFTMTLADGIYTVEEVADELFNALAVVGNQDALTITTNQNTGKITMVITAGNTMQMSRSSAEQFGFSEWTNDTALEKSEIITFAEGTHTNSFQPNWTNGIDSIHLTCSGVVDSYSNGTSSQILTSFVPDVRPYGHIHHEPIDPPRVQIVSNVIDTMRIQLVDSLGRFVELNGDHFECVIVLRPMDQVFAA